MLSKEAMVMQALFTIQNKNKQAVPFMLNPSQLKYDSVKTKHDLIPKARQKGFSSYKVGEHTAKCLGVANTRAVIISHEALATQRLLDKAHYFIEHIKGPKPILGRASRNELYFPKMESTLYIGTAGARAFGRGDTITDLHISEYAWWVGEAKQSVAGLFQAVPASGSITIESTGNGKDNDFYYMVQHAEELGYKTFFRSWWEDDEYELLAPIEWYPHHHEEFFEKLRIRAPYLNENKLFWYYNKLLEFRGDTALLQQEYPTTLDDCFQATGHSVYKEVPYFENAEYQPTFFTPNADTNNKSYRVSFLQGHPIPGYTYVLGGDPSGGTLNDDAGINGICLETLEQVCSFNNNAIDPVAFAYLYIALGLRFNEAYLVCESNNHGAAVIPILRKKYNQQKIFKRNLPISKTGRIPYGFINNETSKKEMLGASLEVIELGLRIYDLSTKNEFEAIHEDESGNLGAKSDNLWISLCFACVGVKKYYSKRKILDYVPAPKPQFDGKFVIRFEDIFNKNLKEGPFSYMKDKQMHIRR